MSDNQEQQGQEQTESQQGGHQQVPLPNLHQYANLLSSPVRRMVYPQLYDNVGLTINTELQREQVLTSEFERLTRQMVFLQEDNARLHQDNSTLVETLDQREIALDNANNTIKDRENEIQELKAILVRKDAEIVSLNNEIGTKDLKYTQLATAHDNLSHWNTKLTADQNDLTARINERDAQIALLHKSVADIQTENTKLHSEVRDFNNKYCELGDENDRLNADLQSNKLEFKRLRDDIQSLTEQVNARNGEIERREAERKQLVSQLDEKTATLLDSQRTCEDYRAENQNLNATIDRQKEELKNQLVELKSLQQKYASLEARNAALTDEVNGLKADKVGLETTVLNKNQTIENLGVNLDVTERERLGLEGLSMQQQAQNHQLGNQLTANQTLTRQLHSFGGLGTYGHGHMGGLYGGPGPNLLARSYLGNL